MQDLARDVRLHGYYGGIRLIKATIKRFVEYCEQRGVALHDRNFSVRYRRTIPRQVGLAGSSAIIVATLRCLMEFYDVHIPLEVQPSLVLSVERDELGIAAGLQDRVIQVYEGLVYMDFDSIGGADGRRLRMLRVRAARSRAAAAALRRLPRRAQRADRGVPQRHPRAVRSGRAGHRRRPCGASPRSRNAAARRCWPATSTPSAGWSTRTSTPGAASSPCPLADRDGRDGAPCGASAKFAGSGGAIVGLYRDTATLERLRGALSAIHCRLVVPIVG